MNFIVGLSKHIGNLFFCKYEITYRLIESSEKLKKYHEQSLKIDLNWIKNALKISNSFEVNFKTVENKRTHAEICLIQISSINETKIL